MKKNILIIFLTVLLLLTGCQEVSPDKVDDTSTTSGVIYDKDAVLTKDIFVHSIEELEYMREMMLCNDENQLADYLFSKGVYSKEELENYIKIVDSVPYVDLLDGDISWINYSQELDGAWEILSVSIKSDNDAWVRFEYLISEKNVSDRIEYEVSKVSEVSTLSQPIFNSDKSIAFFSEIREKHPSGTGDYIRWIADIDGIFTRVFYYTLDASEMNTQSILNNAHIAEKQPWSTSGS